MLDKRQFFINGAWVDPIKATDCEVINPATEQPIATISMGSEEDANAAVLAAKAAFPSFSQTSKQERIDLLKAIMSVYKKRYQDMADIITKEMGAPKLLSEKAQAAVGLGHLQGFIDALNDYQFCQILPNGDIIQREGIGVCGLITPWNWPMNQMVLKIAPALATGCTMVLKPSELTPLSAMLYADILHEAGVPKGVFNLINGEGPVVGSALSRHPDVQMMSFTGSTRGGVAVSKDAAETVKRVALELGGKSPNIIFADSDIKAAVTRGTRHVFANTGQSCNAPTRMLVERAAYEEAMQIAAQVAEQTQVGDPAEEGRHIGPLVSALQYERVQSLIQKGIEEGATLLAGGTGKPEGRNVGYFCKPTVFGNVNNDMTIAREEIFGPVLSIIPFDSEEEAIEIANDTPYGLAAYMDTGCEKRAERVANQLRAGMVRINGSDIDWGSPFGGYKMSGNGREGGHFGMDDFLEIKAISRP
ncbi:MAG: aldehyde dehydrogenase family protein [Cohaesibacter sp.]|nr:aldehyde dehydrogenase family protein [Cohaesibacter sp.]